MVTTPNYDLDVDTTLGGNNASDYIIPSQKAIKSYVDNNSGSTVDQTFDPNSQAAQSGLAIAGELIKYPQKAQNEDITGVYNFVGQKKITFSQATTSDKLGFTCFNASNTEIGAFEYRPNTIGSGALFNVNVPVSSSNYVGFRYWGTPAVNVVAGKYTTAGTYYISTHITDGTNTVTANNNGVVNISSLLSDFVTSSSLSTTLASYATQQWVLNQGYTTNSGTVTSVNNIQPDGNGNVSVSIPVIDQSFDGTSVNGQSGVSIVDLLETIYPVGSIYIGTMSICPLQTLGIGTWQLVSVGRVLQGAGAGFEYLAGASISASLPTLTAVSDGDHSHNRGTLRIYGTGSIITGLRTSGTAATAGPFKNSFTSATSGLGSSSGSRTNLSFDTNLSGTTWTGTTNTTGAHTHDVEWSGHVGTTVQPDAYVVNIWERIA